MDVSYIKSLVTEYGLVDLENVNTPTAGVLLAEAKSQNKALAYVVSSRDVELTAVSFDIKQVKAIDLTTKSIYYPNFKGKKVESCDLTGDYLLVIE